MSVLLDNILIQLRIIAKLPNNAKISTSTSDPIAIDEESNYQYFKRRLFGDSKDQTLKVLNTLIDSINDISNGMLSSSYMNLSPSELSKQNNYKMSEHARNTEQLTMLAREMDNSLKGFANLSTTYKDDPTMSAKLEVIINKMQTQSRKIKSQISTGDNPFDN